MALPKFDERLIGFINTVQKELPVVLNLFPNIQLYVFVFTPDYINGIIEIIGNGINIREIYDLPLFFLHK
ncbi:hypothetical protein AMJ80_03355 [bacterium SM23_31]|nr:MAG: hypothetical protein AMJ80_03355 [bacterium SM23_31]